MLEGVIPTDLISITGHVKITLWNEDSTIVVYDDRNAFQSAGYNYLKNALITTGTLDPVQNMIMTHSGGSSTKSVNISDLGIGQCKFSAVWGIDESYSNVSAFVLRASSSNYSLLSVAPFEKLETYALTVEWAIVIS